MTRARDELVLSPRRGLRRRRAPGACRRSSSRRSTCRPRPVDPGVRRAPSRRSSGSTACERRRPPGSAAAAAGADRRAAVAVASTGIDDYLTCPLKYKSPTSLRVPVPPHHAMIYGVGAPPAVQEFHRRHARGEVMTEARARTTSFEAAWSNEGFLSRDHEEARLDGRPRRPCAGSGPSSSSPARSSRPTSSASSASRSTATGSAAAGIGSTSSRPTRRRRRPPRADADAGAAAPTSSRRPSSCRGRERVTITDYKSSDVRDPAKARQRARDSLQLQIYAMGYEAMTGRLPDAVAAPLPRHRASIGPGRRSTEAARQGPGEDRGGRGRDPGPRLHAEARPIDLRATARSGHLPVERRHVTGRARRGSPAITFDFGNTLVPVGRAALRRVVELTADAICGALAGLDRAAFLAVVGGGARPPVPRGGPAVPRGRPRPSASSASWPGCAAWTRRRRTSAGTTRARRERSDPAEIAWGVDAYSRAFVDALPATPGVGPLLERLARTATSRSCRTGRSPRRSTGTPRRAAGCRTCAAIVVCQRVGTIKPHPAIFEAARAAARRTRRRRRSSTSATTGRPTSSGRSAAGWRTAWLATRPAGLAAARRASATGRSEPDLELASLAELEAHLGPAPPRRDRREHAGGAVAR